MNMQRTTQVPLTIALCASLLAGCAATNARHSDLTPPLRNTYRAVISYIERDSLAQDAMNAFAPVPLRVMDTIGCSGIPVYIFDELVERLYPGRSGERGLYDSLSHIRVPCATSRDTTLHTLSTVTDDAVVLLLMGLDSLSAAPRYILPAYLFRNLVTAHEYDHTYYDYMGAVAYFFIFTRSGELESVVSDIEER